MENHIHLIAHSPEIAKIVKEFKSFTARKIICYLEEKSMYNYLDILKENKKIYKTESIYQVWQEGYHPKNIINKEMFIQKINYLHMNPVRKGFVKEAQDWLYSSARDYDGTKGLLEIDTSWSY